MPNYTYQINMAKIQDCSSCDRYFINATTYRQHRKKKHGDKVCFFSRGESDRGSDSDDDETCIGCRNEFATVDKLERHKCYLNNSRLRHLKKYCPQQYWKEYGNEKYREV